MGDEQVATIEHEVFSAKQHIASIDENIEKLQEQRSRMVGILEAFERAAVLLAEDVANKPEQLELALEEEE